MRLVLTHSGQHYAPKRHARYTPMPAAPPGVSFLCFERTRKIKTLRYAPARSLIYSVSAYPCFCLTPSLNLLSQSEPYCPATSVNPSLDNATNLCFNKHMHKGTFIKRVTQKNQKPQITQHLYNKVLTDLLTSIRQELAAGRKVSFMGFGTFYTRIHKGGKGRNFRTNKPIEYKAVRIPAFRPGSLLKQAVRKKK